MEAVLVMFGSNPASSEPRPFPVTKDATVIGRREDCDLRIPLANVSRAHCKIVKDDANNFIRVEDLGSANGTLVNGKKVQVAALEPGDIITVGPVHLGLTVDGVPSIEDLSVKLRGPSRSSGKPARAKSPAKPTGKPQSLEDEIDAILSGDVSADPDDSGADIHIDLNDSK